MSIKISALPPGSTPSGAELLAAVQGGVTVSLTAAQVRPTLNQLLPSQIGNAGKFLKTDGTNASWAISSGGITNTAINNELMKSDGTNAVPSGFFSTSLGNFILGSSSISGDRNITTASSTANSDLVINLRAASSTAEYFRFTINPNNGSPALKTISGALSAMGNTSVTSTVASGLNVDMTTSGTPTSGFGTGINFSTSVLSGKKNIVFIQALIEDITNGAEKSAIRFNTMTGGATPTEVIRFSSFGGIGLIGANFGTTGQVLTSGGASGAVSWTTISNGISGLTTDTIPIATSSTTIGNSQIIKNSSDHYSMTGSVNGATQFGIVNNTSGTGSYSGLNMQAGVDGTSIIQYSAAHATKPRLFEITSSRNISLIPTSGVGINTSTPLSTLDIVGSTGKNVTSINSNTTLDATHSIVLGDATSGDIIVSLPSASTCARRIYSVKKMDSTGHIVFITPNSPDKIEGGINKQLSTQYQVVTFVCDGTNWWIIGN